MINLITESILFVLTLFFLTPIMLILAVKLHAVTIAVNGSMAYRTDKMYGDVRASEH